MSLDHLGTQRRLPARITKVVLLLLVSVSILSTGGLQLSSYRSSHREWRAAAELERLGGKIIWAWKLDPRVQECRVPCYEPPSFVLPGDAFVSGVHLSFCRDQRLTEKLACLDALHGLRSLAMTNTSVSQAAFRHLAGLSRLEWLDLHDTLLDDASLRHLSAMTHLERLNLQNTRITDASLPHLARFTRLEWLNVGGTGVSAAGLAFLKAHLPNAEILSDLASPHPAVFPIDIGRSATSPPTTTTS
jgi:hypothetical protein